MRLVLETSPSRYVNREFGDLDKPYQRVVSVRTGRWLTSKTAHVRYPDQDPLVRHKFNVPKEIGTRILQFFEKFCADPPGRRTYWNCHIFSHFVRHGGDYVDNITAWEAALEVMKSRAPAVAGQLVVGSRVVFGDQLERNQPPTLDNAYHSAVALGPSAIVQIVAANGYMSLSSVEEYVQGMESSYPRTPVAVFAEAPL